MTEFKIEAGKKTMQELWDESGCKPFLVEGADGRVLHVLMRTNDGDFVVYNKARGADVVFGNQCFWRRYVEPKRKVKMWPALCYNGKTHWQSVDLYQTEDEARAQASASFVRLLTEYPAIEVDA